MSILASMRKGLGFLLMSFGVSSPPKKPAPRSSSSPVSGAAQKPAPKSETAE